jgi:uncharacterized repeat protein (TIGR02543 family)
MWNNGEATNCKHYVYVKNLSYTVTVSDGTVYKFTVNANNGSDMVDTGATTANTQMTHGATASSATAPMSPWQRTGYRFTGWNTAANGSGTSIAAGASFTASTSPPRFTLSGLLTTIRY